MSDREEMQASDGTVDLVGALRKAVEAARERRLGEKTPDRTEFAEARAAGLVKRHETRLAHTQERQELDALRALWWFIQEGMGVCDGGPHATLSWAEVTEMHALHGAVEAVYEQHGYPPKPAEIGSNEEGS